MPRVQLPKYTKPMPRWIPQVICAIALIGLVSYGWIMADIAGMQRGLAACGDGYLIPKECSFLFEEQNKPISDEQVEACEMAYKQ